MPGIVLLSLWLYGVCPLAANWAWAICAAMAHKLLHAAATLTRDLAARGATLRRQLIDVPARLVRPTTRVLENWSYSALTRRTSKLPTDVVKGADVDLVS